MDERPSAPERWRQIISKPEVIAALQKETGELGVPDLTGHIKIITDNVLGSGGYGQVYEAQLIGPESLLKAIGSPEGIPMMAVKEVATWVNRDAKTFAKQQKYFKRELKLWPGLDHPNILPLIGVIRGSDNALPSIVTLFLPHTAKAYCKGREAKEKMPILLGIAEGVAYLHENQITHGDLKADNVLVDEKGNPLVIDFGLSRGKDDTVTSSEQTPGSLRWMAPELLFETSATTIVTLSSDVYAYSMTSYELVTDEIPFKGMLDQTILVEVTLKERRPKQPSDLLVSNDLWKLWVKCWSQTPDKRPNMTEVRSEMRRLNGDLDARSQLRKVVATCTPKGSIGIWDIESGRCYDKRSMDAPVLLRAVAFSPDGRTIVSGGFDRQLQFWNFNSAKPITTIVLKYEVYSLAFSPIGDRLAVAAHTNIIPVYIMETHSKAEELKFEGHTNYVKCVAYSSDGSRLVSGSKDKAVGLWDALTGKIIFFLRLHKEPITAVAFSPDDTFFASASEDHTIRIWSSEDGGFVRSLKGHTNAITSIAFSPNLSVLMIASASYDETIRLWEVESGDTLHTLREHTNKVTSLAFAGKGCLVSSSWDDTIRVWHLQHGNQVKCIRATGQVNSLSFSSVFTYNAQVDGTESLWKRIANYIRT